MKDIKCSNCSKKIGEIETGKVRIKCNKCGTFTTIEIIPELLRKPVVSK